MSLLIPRMIHQIWSGIDEPLPDHFVKMSETWKYDYPDWEYVFWDNNKMNSFVLEHYPQYWEAYNNFQYNVQRWDVIRYLILYKIGGMYVDFDYESLKPMTGILTNKQCCFSQEPITHCLMANRNYVFNNSLMVSIPNHFFIKKVIEKVFSKDISNQASVTSSNKEFVFKTTGQWMLFDVYESLENMERKDIYLIPALFVSPFDVPQANMAKKGLWDKRLENNIRNAYAIHYYFGAWLNYYNNNEL